jgi:AcrR family transcriptional regulator
MSEIQRPEGAALRAYSPTRAQRKQLRSPNEAVRRRLLKAGHELIELGGEPNVRIDEVAEHASVSVGTFYLYFEGKDDLLTAMVAEQIDLLCHELAAACSAAGDPRTRLEGVVHAYMNFALQHTKGFQYYRAVRSIRTTAGDLTAWAHARQADVLRPLLEEGMSTGDFPKQDPELLAQAIVGMTQHLVGYWLDNRERIGQQEALDFMLRSLGQQLFSGTS